MTTENNKIIAEFMEFKIDKETQNYLIPIELAKIGDFKEWADTKHIEEVGFYLLSENQLCFDFDWNWLMEVVEKIESKNFENKDCISFLVKITNSNCQIVDLFKDRFEINVYSKTKIEAVYNACLEFIKWYNENGAKNN